MRMKREGEEEEVWWDWDKTYNLKLKIVCKKIEAYLLQVFTWRVEMYQKRECKSSTAYVMANMNIQKGKLCK